MSHGQKSSFWEWCSSAFVPGKARPTTATCERLSIRARRCARAVVEVLTVERSALRSAAPALAWQPRPSGASTSTGKASVAGLGIGPGWRIAATSGAPTVDGAASWPPMATSPSAGVASASGALSITDPSAPSRKARLPTANVPARTSPTGSERCGLCGVEGASTPTG